MTYGTSRPLVLTARERCRLRRRVLDHVDGCEASPCPVCAAYWRGEVTRPLPVLAWYFVVQAVLVLQAPVVWAVVQHSVLAFCVIEIVLLSALVVWAVRACRLQRGGHLRAEGSPS